VSCKNLPNLTCCARPGLPHEHEKDEKEAIAHARLRSFLGSSLDDRPERGVLLASDKSSSLLSNLTLDELHILGNVLVVLGQVAEKAVDLQSLCFATTLQEPRRRLLQQRDHQRQKSCRNELHGHGNSPGNRLGSVHVVYNAVVYPEANDCTSLVKGFEETGQSPTDSWRTDLGNVDRRDSGNATNAHTGEESSGIYEANLVSRDNAEHCADYEDGVGDDNSHTAAEQLEGWIHEQGTNKTSRRVCTSVSIHCQDSGSTSDLQIEVILLVTSFLSDVDMLFRPKSRLKLSCVMVVPMKAES